MLIGLGVELAQAGPGNREFPTAAFQLWLTRTLWQAAGVGILIYFYYMEALLHHIRLPFRDNQGKAFLIFPPLKE